MTNEQKQRIIKVCGNDYGIDDIPAFWKATKKMERRKAEFNGYKEQGMLTEEETGRLQRKMFEGICGSLRRNRIL